HESSFVADHFLYLLDCRIRHPAVRTLVVAILNQPKRCCQRSLYVVASRIDWNYDPSSLRFLFYRFESSLAGCSTWNSFCCRQDLRLALHNWLVSIQILQCKKYAVSSWVDAVR